MSAHGYDQSIRWKNADDNFYPFMILINDYKPKPFKNETFLNCLLAIFNGTPHPGQFLYSVPGWKNVQCTFWFTRMSGSCLKEQPSLEGNSWRPSQKGCSVSLVLTKGQQDESTQHSPLHPCTSVRVGQTSPL